MSWKNEKSSLSLTHDQWFMLLQYYRHTDDARYQLFKLFEKECGSAAADEWLNEMDEIMDTIREHLWAVHPWEADARAKDDPDL